MLCMLLSATTWSVLQSQTITYAMLLLFLFCVVAMLQSRLTKAAGHCLQHRAQFLAHNTYSMRINTGYWRQATAGLGKSRHV